jgi:hypothetical protein
VDDVRDLLRGIHNAECPLCNENAVRVECVNDYHPKGGYTRFHIRLVCWNCDWTNSGTIEITDILFKHSRVRPFDAFKVILKKFLTLENAFVDLDDSPEYPPEVDLPTITVAKMSKILKEYWSTDGWPKEPSKASMPDKLRKEYHPPYYPGYSIITTNRTNGTNYSAKRKRARKS